MKKPNVRKMIKMFMTSESKKAELENLSDEDVLYEFLKSFETKDIPWETIEEDKND